MAEPDFLSYSWSHLAEVGALEELLRTRGVPLWRDKSGLLFGTGQEDEIRRVIGEACSGAALHLSPEALEGGVGFIPQVEVPAIADRSARDPRFFVGGLFRGYTPAEAQQALHARTGVSIANFWGKPLGEGVDTERLRNAADAVLGAYLGAVGEVSPMTIRVDTREAIPWEASDLIHLGWAPPLRHDLADVDPRVWQDTLLPALAALRRALLNAGEIEALRLRGNIHLSAAVAIGFEFRRPGRWDLQLEDREGVVWSSGPSVDDTEGWNLTPMAGVPGEGPLVVTVGTTHDIAGAVRSHRRTAGPARATLSVAPAAGAGRASVDPGRANGLAAGIAQAIRDARVRYGASETHLYLACPWPLATLVGYHLGSSGPITSFEATVSRDNYLPACRLT